MPKESTFEHWRENSPKNFIFSVKASRYITHVKKLIDAKDSFFYFLSHAEKLEDKLGPILFQLPPSWKLNFDRFKIFIEGLTPPLRYTFEFRNPTWYSPEVVELLQKHNCSFCFYELEHHRSPIYDTADFLYIRLHGPGDKYQGSYTKPQLRKWADKCLEWQLKGKDVYVYFDNDQAGYAAHNAMTLDQMLRLNAAK